MKNEKPIDPELKNILEKPHANDSIFFLELSEWLVGPDEKEPEEVKPCKPAQGSLF